eukprot:snap_masked-scaffold_23-processed-gene-3.33-mRNA-1 protein AED:1.00 eAED:1.00 QI:0/0/0/0/1/1/2/0/426
MSQANITAQKFSLPTEAAPCLQKPDKILFISKTVDTFLSKKNYTRGTYIGGGLSNVFYVKKNVNNNVEEDSPPVVLKVSSHEEHIFSSWGFPAKFNYKEEIDKKTRSYIAKKRQAPKPHEVLSQCEMLQKEIEFYNNAGVSGSPFFPTYIESFLNFDLNSVALLLKAEHLDLASFINRNKHSFEVLNLESYYHFDIKPQNIIVSSFAIPKLSDFGNTHLVVKNNARADGYGTPRYMAPEVFFQKDVQNPEHSSPNTFSFEDIWMPEDERKTLRATYDTYSLGMLALKLLLVNIPRLKLTEYNFYKYFLHPGEHGIEDSDFSKFLDEDVKPSIVKKIGTIGQSEPLINFLDHLKHYVCLKEDRWSIKVACGKAKDTWGVKRCWERLTNKAFSVQKVNGIDMEHIRQQIASTHIGYNEEGEVETEFDV